MEITFTDYSLEQYNKYLECKSLPKYEVVGNTIITDQLSYDFVFGKRKIVRHSIENDFAFDYQLRVAELALNRHRFAAFLDCGLGKTLITLLWHKELNRAAKTLLVCPLAVMQEIKDDAEKLRVGVDITDLRKTNGAWDSGIGMVNFESLMDVDMLGVMGISLDESSILKNADGVTKKWLVKLATNIEYRLCTSATPAPNEQAEYATHAVFLGVNRTEKEFYSRFFRKDGNKYVMKLHAEEKFYTFLRSFCCYIHNPTKLGFQCGGYLEEPPEFIDLKCSGGEDLITNTLIATDAGFRQMKAIERYRCLPDTDRFNKIVNVCESGKSILWCSRNEEEKNFSNAIKNSALITGKTKAEERVRIINEWRVGNINTLISKPKILGWGVNLQQAELMVDSGYNQSMETFYQKIRRSHRYGRKGRLKVYIAQILAEVPIFETIRRKLKTFEQDVIRLQAKFND